MNSPSSYNNIFSKVILMAILFFMRIVSLSWLATLAITTLMFTHIMIFTMFDSSVTLESVGKMLIWTQNIPYYSNIFGELALDESFTEEDSLRLFIYFSPFFIGISFFISLIKKYIFKKKKWSSFKKLKVLWGAMMIIWTILFTWFWYVSGSFSTIFFYPVIIILGSLSLLPYHLLNMAIENILTSLYKKNSSIK